MLMKFFVGFVVLLLVVSLACACVVRQGREGDVVEVVSRPFNKANEAADDIVISVCELAFGPEGSMPNADNLAGCISQVK